MREREQPTPFAPAHQERHSGDPARGRIALSPPPLSRALSLSHTHTPLSLSTTLTFSLTLSTSRSRSCCLSHGHAHLHPPGAGNSTADSVLPGTPAERRVQGQRQPRGSSPPNRTATFGYLCRHLCTSCVATLVFLRSHVCTACEATFGYLCSHFSIHQKKAKSRIPGAPAKG